MGFMVKVTYTDQDLDTTYGQLAFSDTCEIRFVVQLTDEDNKQLATNFYFWSILNRDYQG